MEEIMEGIVEELKRVDHLIFVSLKYTRTVDVIKHVIERFINALDGMFNALAEMLKEQGKLEEIPIAPVQKINLLKEKFADDEKIIGFADFYLKLRKIDKAKFTRSTEFRRHVTMTVMLENDEIVKIDIDFVTEKYHDMREFFDYIKDHYLFKK